MQNKKSKDDNTKNMSTVIYINLSQSIESTRETVKLSEIGTIKCKEKSIESKLSSQIVAKRDAIGKKVVSIMEIIDLINNNVDNADIQSLGQTECVIEFSREKSKSKIMENLKIVLICFILFFGAGFSIMSFNNDVSIDEMFEKVSEQVLGDKDLGVKILSICYSLGLGIGIIVFYNHIGRKKVSNDPTPIQVEMRKYEKEINQAVVEEVNKEKGITK